MTPRIWLLSVTLVGGMTARPAAQADAQAVAGPPRPSVGAIRIPPTAAARATRLELPNGLRLTMLQFGDAPKALVRMVTETGPDGESGCQMAAVLAAVFQSGSARLQGQALSDSVADMGGTWAVTPLPERLSLTLDVLSTFADPAIELVATIVRHPRLDSAAVRQRLADAATGLATVRANIDSAAMREFTARAFPAGQFGAACAPTDRRDGYSATAVRQYYSTRVSPRHTSVYVVGRFDQDVVRRAVVAGFGGWSGGAGMARAPRARHRPTPALSILDRPGAKQVALVVGAPVPGAAAPEFAGFRVADAMLGGSLISRITMNIREAKGYAYSPVSQLQAAPSGDAYWAEVTNVAAPVAWPALREILGEISRLGRQVPPFEEVTGTKRYMVGRMLLQRSARSGWADELEFREVVAGREYAAAGADPPFLEVASDDVRQLVGSYLSPSALTIVVVGDTLAMGSQLADMRRGVEAARGQ
jgi:zinc protease